ncbi:hypothetical protein GCM10011581_06080 [Saccharopolyspora subtropica]|uniref:Uncharacterized protein n=1 Tax=Saccharopolyspora thermophila TaxID=89367 RepID=A0A917N7E6_9PSEU|nr:hypothetical protein [Saccharopolyspora subtropica]GGI71881.1 hypothetical protein GCM10011581_06080 [Saccharopolyspora subtropica]
MNHEQRHVVWVVSVIAVLLWGVLAFRYGWPLWSWVVLAFATLVAPWVVAWRIRDWRQRRERPADQPTEALPAPQAPRPAVQEVSGVPLRSAHPDYRFLFSAKVFWYSKPDVPGLPHANPGGLAVDLVLQHAKQVVELFPPDEADLARHRLTAALGTVLSDPSGHVAAWAAEVELGLSAEDSARLQRLSDARKAAELWEQARDHERRRRAYLAEDVLKNTGSAVVWWLARQDGDLDEAVRQIGNLRRLTAAAHDTRVPDPDPDHPKWIPAMPSDSFMFEDFELHNDDVGAWHHVFAAIEALATGEERAQLSGRLAEVLAAHGHRDLAALVRDRFAAAEARQELPRSETA